MINDMYGFGKGNLAAGRMRVALYGTLERIQDEHEAERCHQAYLAGASRAACSCTRRPSTS